MQQRGESIDLISNPSQAELMQRQFKEKKAALESAKKKAILEKYGGQEQVFVCGCVSLASILRSLHTDVPRRRRSWTRACGWARRRRTWSTGATAAWSRAWTRRPRGPSTRRTCTSTTTPPSGAATTGTMKTRFIRPAPFLIPIVTVARSRLRRQWGYCCCHSLMRNSYCTGEKVRARHTDTQPNPAASPPHHFPAPPVVVRDVRRTTRPTARTWTCTRRARCSKDRYATPSPWLAASYRLFAPHRLIIDFFFSAARPR